MKDQPFVSILLPSYNYARYLPGALVSVLNQTYPRFEVIAFDDGSSDGSQYLLKGYAEKYPGIIRFFCHEGGANRGIAATYRAALKHARGSIIAFLEADDVWQPTNLEEKVAVLASHPDVGIVYSSYQLFGSASGTLYWSLHRWINQWGVPRGRPFDMFDSLLRRDPVASFSHFMMRRELLEGVPNLNFMHRFYDWWVLAHAGFEMKFYFIPKELTAWRIHSESAGYGKVKRGDLFRLHGFLRRLVVSLQAQSAVHGRGRTAFEARQNDFLLERHAWFHRLIEQKMFKEFIFKLCKHPLETMRFAAYVALKNILFPSKSSAV